jgi:hypothetical protein
MAHVNISIHDIEHFTAVTPKSGDTWVKLESPDSASQILLFFWGAHAEHNARRLAEAWNDIMPQKARASEELPS